MTTPIVEPPPDRLAPARNTADGARGRHRRRTRLRTVVKILALVLGAGFAVVALPSAADALREAGHAVRHAHRGWLAVAVLAATGGIVASAIQLMGSTTARLSLIRTTRVQLAASFAAITAPAGLGRLGVDASYLTHMGVEPAEASASVALDALAGVAAHLFLLLVVGVAAGSVPGAGLHAPLRGLRVGAAIVLFAVVVVLLVLRRTLKRLVDRIASALRSARDTLRRPRKVAELLGASLAVTALQIVALVACARAFGIDVGIAPLALVYLVGGGAASLAPTPGNLGAIEAALVAGLVAAGARSADAVAAVVTFRLVTFWSPLLPGAVALFDLRRHSIV